jgi:hypothetical protein
MILCKRLRIAIGDRFVLGANSFASKPSNFSLTRRFNLGITLLAEVMGVLWVRRLSLPDYLASFDPVSGGVSLLSFLLFTAMPVLVERR